MSQAHHNCVMTKNPGYSSETHWHQDIRYWSFQQPELVSVWTALGREHKGNGCLRVLPGSHQGPDYKHVETFAKDNMLAKGQTLIDVLTDRGVSEDAAKALVASINGADLIAFGHLAEGNVHVNVLGAGQHAQRVTDTVLQTAIDLGGTISAEHGIGMAKVEELRRYKAPVEIELMRTVKRALDPLNIMNPGKVL